MIKETLPISAKTFFASEHFKKTDKDILLIFSDEESAIRSYRQMSFFSNNAELFYFPSFDTIPYDRISPSQRVLSERANVLSHSVNSKNKKIIITNATNLVVKLPPPSVFLDSILKITKKMPLKILELSNFLIKNGFTRSQTAIDSGEFAMRGEIIDVVLANSCAYRINFSWDHVESIRKYDIDTQISHLEQDTLIINLVSEVILNTETINNFRNNYLKIFGVNHINEPLYKTIIEGRKFSGHEHFLPLFYNKLSMLNDYLREYTVIYDNLTLQSIIEYEYSYKDFYQSKIQSNKVIGKNFHLTLPPEQICFASSKIKEILENKDNILIEPANSENIKLIENLSSASFLEKKTGFDKLFDLVNSGKEKTPIIFYSSKSKLEKLKNIIESYNYKSTGIDNLGDAKKQLNNIYLTQIPLAQGFLTDKYIFISEQDIFGENILGIKSLDPNAQSAKRKLKNILIELDNLSNGEFVVHKDHGIGQFITVETLEVCGKPHDCLKILYAGNDKLYIPVENIESIKKYGSNEAELDKLGNVSWQKRKSKLKNRIHSIAEKLLQLVAKRKLARSDPIEIDSSSYEVFCSRFPYSETEDQMNAIGDVINDLKSDNLMDRLLCGDVGFGKTEIAMRASFIVSKSINLKIPQVAIIAPTAILCKQHYIRFQERFQDLGFKIAQLSRLVRNGEAKLIKEQIKNGEINIIIGTHALLSKDIEFNNLKLVVIDEEQHFGVNQKERLKELKSDIHVLALSATPIPRTLQMSMVGLKDLSLITTPPMDRLAVHTTVMPFDDIIIRDALLKERFRGGRSFYVVPRIKDIAEIERKLQAIVPELKYKIVHGQMLSSVVDEIMSEFCDGKFDILVSTTIIESGIDIASANTMIIHKADTLGLSQLYQLRGRIGRSKVRGYAYLTLWGNKTMSKDAIKRLEIMQTACSLGTGFTIASHDMDLRGFGNLIGEEQSGQIREVGVELYQEMLDEQLALMRNEPTSNKEGFMPTISLGLPVFIPDNYISDSSLKLGLYRRIGNLLNEAEIENFRNEIIDRFGSIPNEFDNLLYLVKIKHICHNLNIEHLDSGEKGFVLKFRKDANINDMIMQFINKYPRHTKIKPDNKLVFIRPLNPSNIINETSELLYQLSQYQK